MLEKYVYHPETISSECSLSEVLDFFRVNRNTHIVPVINPHSKPIGILRERDMKEYVYSPFGKEILLNRSIKKKLDEFIHNCPALEMDTKIETVLATFSQANEQDGIIITQDGCYYGYLSTFSLLKILHERSLIEKNKASVESLVIGIAHEINTPLGIGVTSASYLDDLILDLEGKFQSGKLKKSEMADYLDKFRSLSKSLLPNLQRAASLIQSFKQVSVHQDTEEKRMTDLYEFVNDLLQNKASALKEMQISVDVHCVGKCLTLPLYINALAEVLQSLFLNAIIHAFDGRREGKITVTITQKGEYAYIDFADNGKGMKPKIVQKIFEPFFTTKRGNYSGLGLHVLENIVVFKMGGFVECESEEGKGTTFHIAIPIK